MSHITNVLIAGARPERIDAVNAWLRENDTQRHQQLLPISMDAAGGSKFWCHDIWAAAFNYVPSGLIEMLRDPETWAIGVLSVQVLIDGEDDMEVVMFLSRGAGETEAKSLYRYDYDEIECRVYKRGSSLAAATERSEAPPQKGMR